MELAEVGAKVSQQLREMQLAVALANAQRLIAALLRQQGEIRVPLADLDGLPARAGFRAERQGDELVLTLFHPDSEDSS